MRVPFKQVDVFTRMPFGGNPVAVVLDARSLDSAQMQRIANWTNLSETTFVFPATRPGADYLVRIFTPRAELPFAGHPTLGTAHALLETGLISAKDGKLVQECAAGLINLSVSEASDGRLTIAFDLPRPAFQTLPNEDILALRDILACDAVSALPPKLVTVGPTWTVVQLADAQAVLSLQPDLPRMAAFDLRCKSTGVVVFGFYGASSGPLIEVRAFAPSQGVNEDPVCGSGNGAVAAFLRDSGQLSATGTAYESSQGAAVGRKGLLHVEFDGPDTIRVGGQSVTCVDGSITV